MPGRTLEEDDGNHVRGHHTDDTQTITVDTVRAAVPSSAGACGMRGIRTNITPT